MARFCQNPQKIHALFQQLGRWYFPESKLSPLFGARHLAGPDELYASWQRVKGVPFEERPLYPTWLE
eukprot:8048273-Pyramimonas_sp.AAC.2